MKRHFQLFFSICQVLTFIKTEPLVGEKIVRAKPLDFPFIASLGLSHPENLIPRESFCTGTLITKRHVLTAAHCFTDFVNVHFDVVIGDVDLSTANTTYEVYSWITYDDWVEILGKPKEHTLNDIAIVTLASEVNREGIIPATLTKLNNKQLHRTNAVIVGWREINTSNTVSEQLFKVNLSILTVEQCEHQLKLVAGERVFVSNNYLCASSIPYAMGECGDSGGPLLGENNVVLGVMRGTCPNIHWGNYSREFLKQYKVNFYSSVDYYREFIKSVTKLICRRRRRRSLRLKKL